MWTCSYFYLNPRILANFPGYSRQGLLFLLVVVMSQCQTKNQTPSHLEAFSQADVIGESSAKDTCPKLGSQLLGSM